MRILVVEDQPTLAQSIKTGLVDESFAVDVNHNGREAYEQASTEEYDVIILDRMLPEMDGIEICKKLRREKIQTPIIMVTAKDTTEDKILGLNCGADDYMIKPFSFEELLARIRSVVRRSTIKDTVLAIDTLEFYPTSHTVKRTGKEITLTGKEYALLEYFMHHPNQIMTREQIMSHVWDYSYEGLSNIIEVMIKRIRGKVDIAFPQEKPLIKTIRGLGYKLGE